MNESEQIKYLESQLQSAMIENDVETLNDLISDDLTFIAMNGDIITKEMDISAHKQNLQIIQKIEQSEQNIKILGNTAIVSVKMDIEASVCGEEQNGKYRYLRTWQKKDNKWQIIAGSMIRVS